MSLFFLQDRDGIPDKYIDFLIDRYSQLGIKNIHILARHEIENYFIELPLLLRSLTTRMPAENITEEITQQLIVDAANKSMFSLQRQIKDRCIGVAKFCNNPENKKDVEIEDEVNQLYPHIKFDTVEDIKKNIPGKEFFTSLHNIVYDRYHINFSITDCLNVLTAEDIDQELKDFFVQLS